MKLKTLKYKHFTYSFLLFSFCLSQNNISYSLPLNDKNIIFLQNLNTFRSNFDQIQYTDKKPEVSTGTIVIKKPDNISLDITTSNMKLKIISINGNVKMIDKTIGQTTYIDNQYSDLMQFFTKNLKPEKLFYNANKEICLSFQNQGINWEGCMEIDLKNNNIKKISVYLIEHKNKTKNIFKNMDIVFINPKINEPVNNNEFYVKDNRIFNDEE